MCGIATLIRTHEAGLDPGVIEAMTEAVRHRGPDGAAVAYFALAGQGVVHLGARATQPWNVAVGHRRLSIIDLSDAGTQPMCYRGRVWVTFNGEIYNYIELRAELERLGHRFRSQSDTEVLLAAYDEWGTDCFRRLRGMWGLVLIDGVRQIAVLSRDRLGIKPLYVAGADGLCAVASEIKQFFCVPALDIRPDEEVLADYIATGYEQEGYTFFSGVTPVPPGTWQSIDLKTGALSAPREYWFPERVAVSIDDPREAAQRFRDSFQESVRVHLRSDVPVGCALSGGLDSSAIAGCVAPLTNGSAQRFETFSVTFPGSPTDESSHVRSVVEFAHSIPHYVTPTPQQFLDDLDRMLWIHDEPVGSLAQYAAYALARLTREAGVPVTLNGQGGDEVLGGYWQSYFMHLRHLARRGRFLRLSGQVAGALLPGGNPELLRQVPMMLRRYRSRREAVAAQESRRGASATAMLSRLMDMGEQERRIFEIRQMYLPRLLKWDDRNFMAFSVEGRYPFLDHEVIELALSFSPRLLYQRGWTKVPLRRGLKGLLPESILRRRTKWGFETPQDSWLRGELRPTLESWLRGDSPLWQFVDPVQPQRLAAAIWNGGAKGEEPGQALMRLYLADRWLRVFFHRAPQPVS